MSKCSGPSALDDCVLSDSAHFSFTREVYTGKFGPCLWSGLGLGLGTAPEEFELDVLWLESVLRI